MKRILMYVGVIAVLAVIAGAIVWKWGGGQPAGTPESQKVADTFVPNMEQKKLEDAIRASDAQAVGKDISTLYSIAMSSMGKDYKLIKSQERDKKISYIYKSDDKTARHNPYIRVILEQQGDKWRVVNFMLNSSEPSAFPASK